MTKYYWRSLDRAGSYVLLFSPIHSGIVLESLAGCSNYCFGFELTVVVPCCKNAFSVYWFSQNTTVFVWNFYLMKSLTISWPNFASMCCLTSFCLLIVIHIVLLLEISHSLVVSIIAEDLELTVIVSWCENAYWFSQNMFMTGFHLLHGIFWSNLSIYIALKQSF